MRIFVSYSHDSEEHRARVLALVERLRHDGVDAWIDRYSPAPPDGWPRWTQAHIEEASFVVVVCTETYRRRFEGREAEGIGRGATLEGMLVSQILVEAGMRNEKFLPLLFDDEPESSIPLLLRPYTSYRHPSRYQDLRGRLTGWLAVLPSPLGSAVEAQERLEPPAPLAVPEGLSEGAPPSARIQFRILVVDDRQDWCRDVREILQGISGDTVVDVAESFAAAQRLVSLQPYSLVVVDLALHAAPPPPQQADDLGMDLLAEIRRSTLNESCAVIVLTGYPEWSLYDRCRAYNVHTIVHKGRFDDRDFLATARRAILASRLNNAKPPWRLCLTISFDEGHLLRSELTGSRTQKHRADLPFDGRWLAKQADRAAGSTDRGTEELRSLREIGLAIRNSLIVDERLLAPLVAEELLSDHPVTVLRFAGPASGLGIPFELLGEGDEGGAWCLRRVIFRQLELTDHVSHKTQAFSRLIAHLLEKKEELRILFVAGSGARTHVYDSEIEALVEEVKADLRGLGLPFRVSMVPSSLASVSFLRQMIRDGRHHLLHYAGPSRWGESLPEGFPLKDGAGVKSLSATGLADLVQSPDLHLVVLNGCPGSETDLFAGFFEALTQADIPAILIHRWPLTDEAGRLLASAFYHELWRTFSLGEALLAARRALVERREEGAAWSSPVLVLQNS